MTKHWFTKALNKYSKTVLAVASALTGAVLGAVVQDVLTTGFRLMEAIACVLSLGIIGLIVSQAVIAESHRTTNEEISKKLNSLLAEVEFSRQGQEAELRQRSESLLSAMKSLAAQFGLQVERLLLSDVNAMQSLEEDPSAQLIYSATRELCVLDLLSEDGRWPDESMEQKHSEDFFVELTRRVSESSPAFAYKRIVQVEKPAQSLAIARNNGFIRHCRSMLELRATKHHRVSLRVAKRRFPFKFMMMDRSRLVLQLQEYDEAGGFRIWGEILISDPQNSLVSIFAEIWDQIDDDPQTKTVTSADLPTLASP